MSTPEDVHPVILRPWVAVAGGAVAGIALAAVVIVAWSFLGPDPPGAGRAAARPDSLVGVFRGPPGAAYEVLLAPAGPDGTGEPELAAGLFPGEEPPRELASLVVANTAALGDWEVDLASDPLRARAAGEDWFDLDALGAANAGRLPPELALRLRGIGGSRESSRIAPGTLRRFVLALPPGRRFSELSDVQWGDRALSADRIDVENLHAFRERPPDDLPRR